MIHERPSFYEFEENLFLVMTNTTKYQQVSKELSLWLFRRIIDLIPPTHTHLLLIAHYLFMVVKNVIKLQYKQRKISKACTKLRKRQSELDIKNFMTANNKLSLCKKLICTCHCLPRKQKRHWEKIFRTAKMFSQSKIDGDNCLNYVISCVDYQ